MNKRILAIPIVFAVTIAYGFALDKSSNRIKGISLIWWLIAQAFLIQILAFIPAFIFNT